MRRLMPREHGVWFMWLVPVLLGAAIGEPGWIHALILLAALFLHLASFAVLESVREGPRGAWLRRWAAGFGLLAAGLLLYPTLRWPILLLFGVLAATLFGTNLAFARARRERTLINDALAIAGLQLWAPVSYLAGTGALDQTAARLWLFCFLYFLGTAFHVKTLFRERSDVAFKRLSNAVHLGLLAAPALVGLPHLALAYLPGALRTWLLPAGTRLRPIVAGLIEITSSVVFMGLLIWLW